MAQDMLCAEFEKIGLSGVCHEFSFNRSLYQNLLLHTGLAIIGTVVAYWWPLFGLALHLLVWFSYMCETTRRGYVLRRLLPFRPTRNLLVTMPARQQLRLRLVLHAHIDAAFTGWLFHPGLMVTAAEKLPRGLRWLRQPVVILIWSIFALALLDVLRLFTAWHFLPVYILLTAPVLFAFILNLQIVLRDESVPGANDNLSGIAALPVLAKRLAKWQPAQVEIVLVSMAAEEASLGGADALCRDRLSSWDRANTVIIGLDGLAHGDLRYLDEGEVISRPVANWLRELVCDLSTSNPRFAPVCAYCVPAGGSDTAPFMYRGYDGLTLACIDPELGTPRYYHQPTDTPERLDFEQIITHIDFAEKLIHNIAKRFDAIHQTQNTNDGANDNVAI
jgi:hypothetical protein